MDWQTTVNMTDTYTEHYWIVEANLRSARCAFMLSGCSRNPAPDDSLLHWTDFTRSSECGQTGAFPKHFLDAARFSVGKL